jgi:hypothetical protein
MYFSGAIADVGEGLDDVYSIRRVLATLCFGFRGHSNC